MAVRWWQQPQTLHPVKLETSRKVQRPLSSPRVKVVECSHWACLAILQPITVATGIECVDWLSSRSHVPSSGLKVELPLLEPHGTDWE